MPLQCQKLVINLVRKVLGAAIEEYPKTPSWLMRPGAAECGEHWSLICHIYKELTGRQLPIQMPKRERRSVDGILKGGDSQPRIIEVDESQHFNKFRAQTLSHYPLELELAFDRETWLQHCQCEPKYKSGGWATPKPPLFPEPGGRHLQRAFRDALTDILPPDYGFLPTLRIAKFEIEDWIHAADAPAKMKALLDRKLQI